MKWNWHNSLYWRIVINTTYTAIAWGSRRIIFHVRLEKELYNICHCNFCSYYSLFLPERQARQDHKNCNGNPANQVLSSFSLIRCIHFSFNLSFQSSVYENECLYDFNWPEALSTFLHSTYDSVDLDPSQIMTILFINTLFLD